MTRVRDLIRMDDAEARDLLAAPGQTMTVATLAADGRPHLTAVWYGFAEDGTLGFTTPSASQKVRNLQRDPRITVLVEAGDRHGELRGVQLVGTAQLSSALPMKLALSRSIAARYPALVHRDPERAMSARTAVLIDVTAVSSWDHRKLPAPGGPR